MILLLFASVSSEGAGSASGVATVAGVGTAITPAVGASAGSASVSAVGVGLFSGVGAAAGSATVSGIGGAIGQPHFLPVQANDLTRTGIQLTRTDLLAA